MTYLVNDCNHWIHFHIIEELLLAGYRVEGIKNDDKDDHLLMFFGRNSNFSIAKNMETKHYQHVISFYKPLDDVETRQAYVINPVDSQNKRDEVIYIQTPLLFGEWMPMNKKGMYINNKFISFDSKSFLTKSIYIKDFAKAFIQWTQMENKKQEWEIVSKNDESKREKLEKLICFRDNGPIEEQLNQVLEHYNMYSKLYNR